MKSNRFALYRDGLGTLVGTIFGAGVFALPFSFIQAGSVWGFALGAVALFLMLVLHLMYGEVAYLTPGRHRLTGYVRTFLGRPAERLAFITTLFGYYGTFLVYGLLGGIFLHVFFPGVSVWALTLAFFAASSLASLFRFEKIGAINFYLTIPIVGFVVYLFWIAVTSPSFHVGNFTMAPATSAWFLPYGIWLFALSGFSGVPEARDLLRKYSLRDFKRIITMSLTLSAFLYMLFVIAVVGVSGSSVTKDAITGLSNGIGRVAIPIGSLIGLIAVFTSYIALAADLIGIFTLDYRRSLRAAWLATIVPAIVLFLFGFTDLVKILGLVGAVGFGVLGIFIVEMARRLHRAYPNHEHILLSPHAPLRWLLMAGLIAGVVLEVANAF